ncbi:MAG: hypothetical protein H6Q24_752, partial [Bacteroidetes bacterium]|nr:hypothetical protein [Bacteroidota bacterium]
MATDTTSARPSKWAGAVKKTKKILNWILSLLVIFLVIFIYFKYFFTY